MIKQPTHADVGTTADVEHSPLSTRSSQNKQKTSGQATAWNLAHLCSSMRLQGRRLADMANEVHFQRIDESSLECLLARLRPSMIAIECVAGGEAIEGSASAQRPPAQAMEVKRCIPSGPGARCTRKQFLTTRKRASGTGVGS
mmetsp:Transcript_76301/g.247491  ORF Transcript_76301/g.247491 Transcript_76301/m.247491 type:complete len:143 (-) Transcript_76301:1436-1864(-)